MDDPDDGQTSLAGLVIDIESIREKYLKHLTELKDIIDEDDLEKYQKKSDMDLKH